MNHYHRMRPDRGRLCVIALLMAAAIRVAAQSMSVGPNVNINRQVGDQWEEAIAVNPANPSQLFAWSNDFNSDNSAAYSINGGVSWISRFTGSDGWPGLGGDPTCTFDKYGNLLAASFDSNGVNIEVRASVNGGQTFSIPKAVINGTNDILDQPTIKAGPGTTTSSQSVWITHFDYNAGGLVARGAVTLGLGSIGGFGSALLIPGSGLGNFGDVAIGTNGKVAIAYQTLTNNPGPSTIHMAVNSSGSTAGSFILAAGTVTTQVGGFRSIPAQPNRTVDAELGLAYDVSSGLHRGRLHMVYTDAPNTNSNDLNIFTRYSDNDGATWSAPHRVNSDTGTNSQFFSKIALDPTTGFIAVAWYDCRNCPTNNRVELWGTVSLDGGVTFLPEVKISAGSTYGVGKGSTSQGDNELGDYIGLDFYNGVFHPCWADDSNSTGNNPDGTANLDYYTAAVTVVPAKPVLTAQGFGTNGLYQFKLASTPMMTFGVDASSNLTSWTNVGSGNTGTNGYFIFQDTNAASRYRFYRGHWPYP